MEALDRLGTLSAGRRRLPGIALNVIFLCCIVLAWVCVQGVREHGRPLRRLVAHIVGAVMLAFIFEGLMFEACHVQRSKAANSKLAIQGGEFKTLILSADIGL